MSHDCARASAPAHLFSGQILLLVEQILIELGRLGVVETSGGGGGGPTVGSRQTETGSQIRRSQNIVVIIIAGGQIVEQGRSRRSSRGCSSQMIGDGSSGGQ